jgi:nicotinate-nucleotide adenylyltransferase
MHIIIFGGTFDPPTLAHEAIIAACLQEKGIDEVWVMPSGQRPDKPQMRDDAERLALLRAVKETSFQNEPRLRISDFEMRLPQPTETTATVVALEESYPGYTFWFVFGADSYQDMPAWRGGIELQRRLHMIVVPRGPHALPAAGRRVRHISVPDTGISSTLVRQRLREGRTVTDLVSAGVQALLSV